MSEHIFEEIAVVGMACRFPKSNTSQEFWKNLREGKELISFFTKEELEKEGVSDATLQNPRYVRAKGILEDAQCFDASFFFYSPKEAETMDPQQRILLQCAWEALENAGFDPEQSKETIGVFVGCNPSSYFLTYMDRFMAKEGHSEQEQLQLLIGNGHDYLATRLSYKLNLKGPSKTIQTACSTSLVAVHDACQSLLNYQCDLALAGGVSVTFPQKAGYFYSPEGVSSPDGKCRAFDSRSEGTVFGDGVGLVVLKRLEEAIQDGDTILAVIKGSAVNNDGADKMSFLSPSVHGQAQVIASALAAADLSPDTISYVETHGTATPLGDPIEIAALNQAFRLHTQKTEFCAIGSVKTNTGHLISAAGIAGLIKTILMLNAKEIPPSLHFEQPNPKIPFSETCFKVNRKLTPWQKEGEIPLRAGVSSFGMGGTNAHLILEEPPSPPPPLSANPSPHLIPFSAATAHGLETLIEQMGNYLQNHRPEIADIAYTLQYGRKMLAHRTYFVCSTLDQLIFELKNFTNSLPPSHPIGDRWMKGEKNLWKSKGRRIPLPTYPFAKTSFVIESGSSRKEENLDRAHLVAAISTPHEGSEIEKIISIIWEAALKVQIKETSEDFFLLGGDSLAALEVLDKCKILFSIDYSLADFFSHSTIQQMGQLVENRIKNRALTQTQVNI